MQILSYLLQKLAMASPLSIISNPLHSVVLASLAGVGGLSTLMTLAYGGTCLVLYQFQRKLIFRPQRLIQRSPADIGLAYEEVWIPVTDSEGTGKVHSWWIPNPESDRTLLFFHGNYGNISDNLERIRFHHALGFSVLAIDYRGYGESIGNGPTEQTTYADAQAAWQYLTTVRQLAPEQITVYGHSLGGAIAIHLAIKQPRIGRLIVKSSFTTMKDAIKAKSFYRLFPVEQMLTEPFDSLSKVKHLKVPVLYVHGDQDPDIPAEMSQRLYDKSPEPKQIWFAVGADHNNVSAATGDTYGPIVKQFCSAAV